jgi:hypothetical protein
MVYSRNFAPMSSLVDLSPLLHIWHLFYTAIYE